MEAANFEEHRDHCRRHLGLIVRPLPHDQFRINDNDYNYITSRRKSHYPLFLVLQFHLTTKTDAWYLTPDHPSQLLYMDQFHANHTNTFHIKLLPSKYLQYNAFYCLVEAALKREGGHEAFNNRDVIHSMICQTRYHVHNVYLSNKGGTTTNCQILGLFVRFTLKTEYILDGRLQDLSSRLNGGMVPASKTSIMQLPERMEIDEDHQCLNDDCVICFEQLVKEGKKIMCMPCSHMFHGDCITTWLDKSHYCPVCRFDMPTTTTTQV